ncbi:MAG: glycine betaine ABC transporter substrate-binding protein [bacterium]|nr:glycine betaine ABC transporter substrate-binding protein [bacterium]
MKNKMRSGRWIGWIMIMVLFGISAMGCASRQTAGTETATSDAGTEKAENAEAAVQDVKAIQIATKPMTEQYILGEMLKLLIETDTDYTAEITKGIGGGTSNIQPAMEKGEFDLYPEYTSSGWVMVLGHEAAGVSDEEMFAKLKEEYQQKFDMTWVGLYGFNNTFAVVARKDIVDQYNLKTTSDLAAIPDTLVFGGNPDYIEREDGFGLLCDTYGIKFKDVKDIDIGLKYEAMASGDIDVTNGYTTDAQIGGEGVAVLEDDQHLQANYFCSTVVRKEALENYPGLEDVLMKMDGILSDQDMAGLNYQVEVEGKDEAEVAKEYLTSKGLVK